MTVFDPLHEQFDVHWALQSALLVSALLVLAGVLVRRRLGAAPDGGVLPDDGITLRNMAEVLIEGLANLARERMGPNWRSYFPLVGTIFLFILLSNLIGLIPGFAGATSESATTWSWAILAWVVYTAIGISHHKGWYIVKFMGPSFFEREMFGRKVHFRLLAPVFLVLEIPLDVARIATLSIRLLANMYADHTVIAVWLSLVPIGVPAIFFGLGLVVSVLQAFIFALLTMIYIGLALDEPH